MSGRRIGLLGAAAMVALGLVGLGAGTASADECGFNSDNTTYNNCSGHPHTGTVQAYDAIAQKNFSFDRCFPPGVSPVPVDGLQSVTNVVGHPDNPC
jgi:hypothetical protein